MVTMADYIGPFQKTVGLFTRQLERTSVHVPHYRPGVILCSLELKDKFLLFVRGSYDPIIFLDAGFEAGLDQAGNEDPTFGQGAGGYAKRFAANYTDQASFRFFKEFAYPTIFDEDPPCSRSWFDRTGVRFLSYYFVATCRFRSFPDD